MGLGRHLERGCLGFELWRFLHLLKYRSFRARETGIGDLFMIIMSLKWLGCTGDRWTEALFVGEIWELEWLGGGTRC